MATSKAVGPLARLGSLLLEACPVGLGELASWAEEGQWVGDFIQLVEEYLPECRDDIMAEESQERRCWAFANAFEKRYFPIAEVEEYEYLLSGIPVYLRGVSAEDHHDQETYRKGLMLQVALVTEPEWSDGTRVVLLEYLAEWMPGLQQVLEQLPPKGFSAEELERLTVGTRFACLGTAAQWWHSSTGNVFLDKGEADGWELPQWDSETVQELTPLWREADDLMRPVDELADWLEEAPLVRMEELVRTILEKEPRYDGPAARREREGWQLPLEEPIGESWGGVGAAEAATGEAAGG